MTERPRTIQIFLPKGDPRGLRVAELTTSIVRVVEVPRSLLPEFASMPEAKQVGFYFLVGEGSDEALPSVYIGQSSEIARRLGDHHKSKDFWTRALVVVSLTNNMTSTHVLYLEQLCIQTANDVGRFKVENGTVGNKTHVPPPLEADCQGIFDVAKTLLSTLGYPIFDALNAKPAGKAQEVFFCKGKDYEAKGLYTEEGMVVLKGSRARKHTTPSLQAMGGDRRRKLLLSEGVLLEEGESYVFQRDTLFKTPSGASDAVVGASTNGWTTWKDKNGKTLDALKRADSSTGLAD